MGSASLWLLAAIAAVGCAAAPITPAGPGVGAVSTADPLATRVGLEILGAGGNAADAAVAVGFALAVVYPSAGNLGGGGFAVSYRPGDAMALALDFRETAPAGATRDMYLDADGSVVPERSRTGHCSVGVPGSVAGLWALHQRLGRLAWADCVAPAIALAADGFRVSAPFADELRRMAERLRRHPATAAQFLRPDGEPYGGGEMLRQLELAGTLRRIADLGPAGFYRGPVADAIVAEMHRGGGLVSHGDLAAYRAKWREPVWREYRGRTVWSMPPPSSGGLCLAMLLGVLAGFEPSALDLDRADGVHRYVEAARRVYADRATHLGDPDFWPVPTRWLGSDRYAAERRAAIGERATPSQDVSAGTARQSEGEQTTHYSVLDADGFAVSLTTTLNFGYGSLVTVPGAGFLLNNEMDDFSAKPGVPNAYGLVGNDANAIAPGKRMLSSMAPTIVTREGAVELVVGTPGGATIITTVLQVLLRVLDRGQSLDDAVRAPRAHHQWVPDRIDVEDSRPPAPALLDGLVARGHAVQRRSPIGDVCAIQVTPEAVHAVADDRGRGAAGTVTRSEARFAEGPAAARISGPLAPSVTASRGVR